MVVVLVVVVVLSLSTNVPIVEELAKATQSLHLFLMLVVVVAVVAITITMTMTMMTPVRRRTMVRGDEGNGNNSNTNDEQQQQDTTNDARQSRIFVGINVSRLLLLHYITTYSKRYTKTKHRISRRKSLGELNLKKVEPARPTRQSISTFVHIIFYNNIILINEMDCTSLLMLEVVMTTTLRGMMVRGMMVIVTTTTTTTTATATTTSSNSFKFFRINIVRVWRVLTTYIYIPSRGYEDQNIESHDESRE
jgi:hypothetical protein